MVDLSTSPVARDWSLVISESFNQHHVGRAELCDWMLSIPLPSDLGAGWLRDKLIESHKQELQAQGSILLELHVWQDMSPGWRTEYYVRTVATASPLFWKVIIVGIVAALIIFGVTWALVKVEDIARYIGEEAPAAARWMIYAFAGLVIVGLAVGLETLVRRRRK